MKIYFRANIWYDYARCDVNDISIEYSLNPFDKSKSAMCGFYEYSQFDLPESYTKEQAEDVAKRVINEFDNNGASLNSTLKKILAEK